MYEGTTNRIGGAQLATMTFLAPTSFAIWIISFEVVPRTMESAKAVLVVVLGWQINVGYHRR